jgi:membrane-associated protease RseP (regulator of RpoE activity)
MQLWPFRRQAPAAPPDEDLLLVEDLLRRSIEDLMVVRERQIRSGAIVFGGALLMEPGRALDLMLTRFKPFGYTPFLKEEAGLVRVHALPLAEVADRQRLGLSAVLFVLTCVSTLLAGYFFVGSPTFDALRASESAVSVLAGLPFALTLLSILGVHEFGHYLTARHYRASVSLPYFIPAPPPIFLFGTLGAVIRMRSPVLNRNTLFDIAAAGPLAGLAIALPAIVLGLEWSTLAPIPSQGRIIFGDSLLIGLLVQVRFGAIPEGMMLLTHPVADAAWAGCLVTAINLFPAGQLDGGRIAYALFGRRHRLAGHLTFAALIAMWVLTQSPSWLVWAALIFLLIGFHHSPPLDDLTPLSRGRRVLGIACLLLILLLTPLVPVQFA